MEPEVNVLCPECWTYYNVADGHECRGKMVRPLTKIQMEAQIDREDTPVEPSSLRQTDFIDQAMARATEALNFQTGGSNYLRGTIQPIEFFHDNSIPFAEASAMKYLFRWRDKGGVQDLKKVIQICLQLIAMEGRQEARREAQGK